MPTKRHVIAKAPTRNLMRRAGAIIVSGEALESLIVYLEERSKLLTASALKLARHAKRKKIIGSDMQLAIDIMITR